MKNKFRKFLTKIKLAKHILFSDITDRHIFVSTEDQIKASIKLSLIKNGIRNEKIEDEILIKKLVDSIYVAFDTNGFTPFHSLDEVCNSLFKDQAWNLAIAAGIATIWELKVRILAERIGVNNYIEKDKKSKKSKNMHSIGYKDLDTVIKNIEKILNYKLKINLSQLNEFRGALVHANLQQLRILYNNSHKNFKESLKGNVITLSLNKKDDKLLNLSDSHESSVSEEQDIFAWFIEGTNSQMLYSIIQDFENCIRAIDDIIGFRAHSYNECALFFNKVFFENQKLTVDEETIFLSNELFNRSTRDSVNFFTRIYSYLKI